MSGTHHPFSPSSLARRAACPASFLLEKNLPDPEDTADASEGTMLHNAVATGDLTGLDPDQRELIERCLEFRAQVCKDMEIHTEMRIRLLGTSGKILTEGTADVAAFNGTEGVIIDWKFGRNEVPEAADNLQLGPYAAGLMQRYGLASCRAYIFQPRLNHSSSCLYTDPGPVVYGVTSIIAGALDPAAEFRTGPDQCRYCKGAHYGNCPALHREALELAKNPPGTEELARQASGELLTRFYLAAEPIVKALGYVKEELRTRCRQNNGYYLNWELSEGRRERKCTRIEQLHDLLTDTIGTEDFLRCCSVSVSQLETLYADRQKTAGKVKTLKAGKDLFGQLTSPVVELSRGSGTLRYVPPVDVTVSDPSDKSDK